MSKVSSQGGSASGGKGQWSNVKKQISFVFFGTDEFSIIVLDELKKAGYVPALIVTAPDRPKGRGLKLTPPPIKQRIKNQPSSPEPQVEGELRIKEKIEILQPETLDEAISYKLKAKSYDVFIVASYGKIIPKEILDIPKHGALNVHPSLLPLYRGPSPIESQILDGVQETGITIMLVDEEMDHGPIISDFRFQISDLGDTLPTARELETFLAHAGGKLLTETIPKWIAGEITPREQDHAKATYTKKITKEDGLIDLNGDPELNYRKFLAYSDWPSVYFFQNGKRIKIIDAEYKDGIFAVKKIIPEGKKEVDYQTFLRVAKF